MYASKTTDEYITEHADAFTEDLKRLIAQPSVSATGEGVYECADLLHELCEEYGFDETHTLESSGMPYVVSKAYVDHDPDNDYPTLLVYGHYDTQPVDEEEWENPPFEPTIIEGPDGEPRIHARGSGDNKGNHFPHICAVKTLRETDGLPLNITLFLDGEEESGSPNIEEVVRKNIDLLEDADMYFSTDGSIHESGRPEVSLGSRGIVAVKVEAEGPNRDLHSGHWGGSVPNPAWELVNILSSMKDETGRVTIDGFYDDVRPITDRDREVLAEIPVDEEQIKEEVGIIDLAEGPGDTHLEKQMFYPTLNIAGFSSGYTGDGFKTIAPAKAQYNVDMRLAADQDADDIFQKFKSHVEAEASGLVDIKVSELASRNPNRAPVDSPYLDPIIEAIKSAWDVDPIVYPSSGASGPSDVFALELDVHTIGTGYANSDEQQHSPYENMSIPNFEKGIRTSVKVFQNLAQTENK